MRQQAERTGYFTLNRTEPGVPAGPAQSSWTSAPPMRGVDVHDPRDLTCHADAGPRSTSREPGQTGAIRAASTFARATHRKLRLFWYVYRATWLEHPHRIGGVADGTAGDRVMWYAW